MKARDPNADPPMNVETPSASNEIAPSERQVSVDGRDVGVTFPNGVHAVQSVNLRIARGERLALIGPSGCGKTTFLRAIAGLQPLTSGTIQRNLHPNQASEHAGCPATSFVFQQPALLPWRRVVGNVTLPLELGGNSRTKRSSSGLRSLAQNALAEVDLTEAEERLPDQLSGGMQMRVSIARAIVTDPRLLLLDEPFAALDDMLRTQLGQLVTRLWRQHQFTMVLVTHNIAEAILLSDRICVMHEGRITRELDNPLNREPDAVHTDTVEPGMDIRRTAAFAEFFGEVSDALQASVIQSDHQGLEAVECPS